MAVEAISVKRGRRAVVSNECVSGLIHNRDVLFRLIINSYVVKGHNAEYVSPSATLIQVRTRRNMSSYLILVFSTVL